MALHYNLVAVLLGIECLVCLVLLSPLPSPIRRSILRSLESPLGQTIQRYHRIAILFVLVLFIDATLRAYRIHEEIHPPNKENHDPAHRISDAHVRMFYSQRNAYLTGFTLFLSLLVARLIKLVVKFDEMERHIHSLKMNEKMKEKGEDEMVQQVGRLQSELDALEKELAEAKHRAKDLDMVKDQANRQREEYLRMLDRYNALEAKLEGRSDELRKDK